MSEVKNTDWFVSELDAAGNFDVNHIYIEPAIAVIERKIEGFDQDDMRNARLIAAAPDLLKELLRAQEFIDGLMQELHGRRISDWYPEGANNAALSMSDDMRLLGNACADFDVSDAIEKATRSNP